MPKANRNAKTALCLILALFTALPCFSTVFAQEAAPEEPIILEELGEDVEMHSDLQERYLQDAYYNIANYAGGTKELSKPRPVTLSWSVSEETAESTVDYCVEIAENGDFKNCRTLFTEETSCDIYNLKLGTAYAWRVTAETQEGEQTFSETSFFTTESTGPRVLYVPGVTNVRDIGGYPTVNGGRVKQGMLIRCAKLHLSSGKVAIEEEGVEVMVGDLGIKTEIDLRTAFDGDNGGVTESALGDGVQYCACPMDYRGNMLTATMGEDNVAAVRKVFEILSDEANYPVAFHCSIGTDRTGMMAYIFEGLLGVSETDMFRDYLFSNFGKIGDERSVSTIRLGYPLIFKNTQGKTLSESIYRYLADTVGVPEEQLDAFIRINTEPYGCGCSACYGGATLFTGNMAEAFAVPPKSHMTEGKAVSSEAEFLAMEENGSYFLTADFKLTQSYKGTFRGKLNGNGHTLTVSAPVFEQLSGEITYLTLKGSVSGNNESLGALAAVGKDFYVMNVINNAAVTAEGGGDAGGFIGTVSGRARFIRCTNCGDVTASGNAGGFVGRSLTEFTAEKCINCGAINAASASAANCAGGILGCSEVAVFIQNCENNGAVAAKGRKVNPIAGSLNERSAVNTAYSDLNGGEATAVTLLNRLGIKNGTVTSFWDFAAFFMKLVPAFLLKL